MTANDPTSSAGKPRVLSVDEANALGFPYNVFSVLTEAEVEEVQAMLDDPTSSAVEAGRYVVQEYGLNDLEDDLWVLAEDVDKLEGVPLISLPKPFSRWVQRLLKELEVQHD